MLLLVYGLTPSAKGAAQGNASAEPSSWKMHVNVEGLLLKAGSTPCPAQKHK